MKFMRKAKTLQKVGPDEASQAVKKYAAKQKIKIQLTDEQINMIMDQWNEINSNTLGVHKNSRG